MLGERIPAPQALEWGLINRVAADDEFDAEVDALADAPGRRPDRLLRRLQAPAQRLAVRAAWTSSSSSRRRSSRRWPPRGDFLEGVRRSWRSARREFKGS